MCPKTENFLAGDDQWSEDVKKALEDEFPTMEIRLLKEIKKALPALVTMLAFCKGGDEMFKQALKNASLIIDSNTFDLLEQRFYRMLTAEKYGQEFWEIWKWTNQSISVLTEATITSAKYDETIKKIQDGLAHNLLNLKKRFNTFYNNKSHS